MGKKDVTPENSDVTSESVEVELLHPITHDFQEFSRGVHKVAKELADVFLKARDAITGKALAQQPRTSDAPRGTVSEAADSPRRLGTHED